MKNVLKVLGVTLALIFVYEVVRGRNLSASSQVGGAGSTGAINSAVNDIINQDISNSVNGGIVSGASVQLAGQTVTVNAPTVKVSGAGTPNMVIAVTPNSVDTVLTQSNAITADSFNTWLTLFMNNLAKGNQFGQGSLGALYEQHIGGINNAIANGQITYAQAEQLIASGQGV